MDHERGRHADKKGGFTDWMLLSYKNPVTASSHLIWKTTRRDRAVDEKVKTFWAAAKKDGDQWLQIDLEKPSTLRAFQINYHD